MTEPMTITLRAKAPAEQVWRALTDPVAMRVWLAEHAEVELPHRYQFWGRYTPEGDAPRQQVLHAADNRLVFDWELENTKTTVTIRLTEESADATVLTLEHDGLTDFATMMSSSGALAVAHTYWALVLVNLIDHLEGREPIGLCDLTSPRMRAEFLIDASPRQVYDSLVEPEQFVRWFGARIDVEPQVGGRWAMGGFELDEAPAKILALEPGKALSLGWDNGLVATWELAESQGRTRLTFVQSGFDEADPPYDAWMGWLSGFAELRRYHEVPDWRPMWMNVRIAGMPEGMIVLD